MYYEAIYRPAATDHLNTEATRQINKRLALQYGWQLDDGPFKGQHCYIPSTNFGCIPESELKDLQSISFIRWKELQKESK